MQNDLETTLKDILAILLSGGYKFHLTGGLVSSFYGEPRFTQDIDIVVRLEAGPAFEQLLKSLKEKFLVEENAARQAVRHSGIFQALHEDAMIKIDFHVGEAIEGELMRSVEVELLPGIKCPIVKKEDAILSKLIWVLKGSHKSRQDILMMLKRSGDVDLDYIHKQAKKLKVEEILAEILGAD